jgi:integrase/recombinase XerD
MEVFYSTAIRRAELINLEINDIDKQRAMIFIRKGKGNKDRYVPIGERALAFLELYMEKARPIFSSKAKVDEGKIFLSRYGDAFLPASLNTLLSKYINSAAVNKGASCHVFRHTCATLMLENGADIRYIQEMLGHSSLATTQIYTKVFDTKLKEVHSRTHPSAKLLKPILPIEIKEQSGNHD